MKKYFIKLFITINIHLKFHHKNPILSTQIKKTKKLNFLFINLFKKPYIIKKLTNKITHHNIYLFTNFIINNHTIIIKHFQNQQQ